MPQIFNHKFDMLLVKNACGVELLRKDKTDT